LEYNNIWDNYIKNIFNAVLSHKKEHKNLEKLLLRYSKKNSLVLEAGCGSAIDSSFLATMNRRVVAIDLSIHALKAARVTANYLEANVTFIRADLRYLPFKNEIFDLVFSSAVLHFFKDMIGPLNEQKRILKKGGYLILDVPNKYSFHTIYKKYKMMHDDWPWGWETEYTSKELNEILKSLNFEVVERYSWGLDRISKILFAFDETRYGRKLPKIIINAYRVTTAPIKYFIGKFLPVNIGFVCIKK